MKKNLGVFIGMIVMIVMLYAVTADAANAYHITTNTIWTKKESPYIFTSDVIVDSGINLIINPGVKVKFKPIQDQHNYSMIVLIVKGKCIAQGTTKDSIFFTSTLEDSNSSNWKGIIFENADSAILKYCVIKHSILAIEGRHSSINIRNSLIRDNRTGGIWCFGGSLVADSNTIIHNGFQPIQVNSPYIGNGMLIGAIYGQDCNFISITNNLIADNFNCIHCWRCMSNIICRKNTIRSERYPNIVILPYYVKTPLNIDISGNIISGGNYGILMENTDRTIEYPITIKLDSNVIEQNKIGLQLYSWGEDTLLNLIATRNNFLNDSIGVYLGSEWHTSGEGKFGSINFGKLTNVKGNGNNIFYQNKAWDIYNKMSDTIWAQNCLWGMTGFTSIDSVASKIYDHNKDTHCGPVVFTPFLGYNKVTKHYKR